MYAFFFFFFFIFWFSFFFFFFFDLPFISFPADGLSSGGVFLYRYVDVVPLQV